MSRLAILSYGVLGYAVFLATFLYLIGFVTGFACLWGVHSLKKLRKQRDKDDNPA